MFDNRIFNSDGLLSSFFEQLINVTIEIIKMRFFFHN